MSLLSQFFPKGNTSTNTIPIEIFGIGGGGGGSGAEPAPTTPRSGAGGGAGMVIYQKINVTPGISYPIAIGAGGAGGGGGGPGAASIGSTGNNTLFESIAFYGGGGGTAYPFRNTLIISLGSGGGGVEGDDNTVFALNTSTISENGFILAHSGAAGGKNAESGGGGGALSGGCVPYKEYTTFSTGILGLIGEINGHSGIPLEAIGISTIAVGGGGGGTNPVGRIGNGGFGGGGPGGSVPINKDGTANTGGGGGGVSGPPFPLGAGGSGGSGVLFVRYPTAYAAATVSGNTPAPSQPGYYVYRWNSGPGSITFN